MLIVLLKRSWRHQRRFRFQAWGCSNPSEKTFFDSAKTYEKILSFAEVNEKSVFRSPFNRWKVYDHKVRLPFLYKSMQILNF